MSPKKGNGTAIVWSNKKVKISDLKESAYNPRKLSKKNEEDLDQSLERWEKFTGNKAVRV